MRQRRNDYVESPAREKRNETFHVGCKSPYWTMPIEQNFWTKTDLTKVNWANQQLKKNEQNPSTQRGEGVYPNAVIVREIVWI